MGRILKRVPLDFDYPQGKVWEGYLNPIRPLQCELCEGTGESPEVRRLMDRWYGHDTDPDWVWCDEMHNRRWNRVAWNNNVDEEDIKALLEGDRLWDFTRVPRNEEQVRIVKEKRAKGENSWLPFDNGYIPTPDEVNEWHRHSFGHDSLNAWYIVKAKALKYGWPLECAACNGEGHLWINQETKEAYDAWESSEPPEGEGYQLWETTTEGSPNSPVFETLEALCLWCAENATTFGSYKASKAEWMSMLSEEFVYHQEGSNIFI